MTDSASEMRSRGLWRFGLSAAVSIVLVAFLLRDISARRVIATLQGVYIPGVALGAAAFLVMVAARVARYRMLLRARVPLLPLTGITLVRGMLGDLLPARLGTLSYVWLITRRAAVPLDDAMASFLLAFVFDLLAIAPLLLLALAVVGGGAGGIALGGLALALLVGSLLGLWLLAPALRAGGRLLEAWSGSGPGWWRSSAAGLTRAATGIATRVQEVEVAGVLLPVFFVSLLVRVTKFAAHWLLLQAVLVPLGVPWGTMGFWVSFLGIAGAEMSAMLPISGLASFGTWEAAFAMIFTGFGLGPEQAVLAGFATHILSQALDYSLGVVALLALMWPRPRPIESEPDQPRARR